MQNPDFFPTMLLSLLYFAAHKYITKQWFYAKFTQKILNFCAIFWAKMVIISSILKIFQKNSLTLFPYMLWSSGKNFSQFNQKMKGVKILA